MTTVLRGEKPGRAGRLESGKDGATYAVDRIYFVESTVRNESEIVVLTTTGLPRIGISFLSGFPGAICRELRPEQNAKQAHLWEVTATFSTRQIDQEPPNTGPGDTPNPDPTTWVPKYAGRMQYYQEVIYEDFSSTPKKWVNYAGVPFSEPLTITRPVILFDFWQMEAKTVTNKTIGDRNDCINNGSITLAGESFPQYTLKCSVVEFERGWFYGYEVVNIHYQIAYKPSKWILKPLQVGYEYRSGAGQPRVTSPKLIALETNGTLRSDTLEPLADNEFLPHKPISFSFLRT
jgi:hypothetical protein